MITCGYKGTYICYISAAKKIDFLIFFRKIVAGEEKNSFFVSVSPFSGIWRLYTSV
jgi:hypothetical protein